jgi:uroporphyrinogen-III decarboxylase
VREQLALSGAGAPFVLCTGSPIPSDVEPEAVDAMLRAVREAT